MSRTDKQRPLWVQERDPLLRADFREDHDHRSGRCDLDARLADTRLPWSATSCHISFAGHRQICGCRMCSAFWARLHARRRDRHTAATWCRNARKDPGCADAKMPPVKRRW